MLPGRYEQLLKLEKNMNTHADKIQENKNHPIAIGSVGNQLVQKQTGGESAFQFIDNRPEAIAQRKLREVISNSPQVRQLRILREIANNSIQLKPLEPIQKNVVQLGKESRKKAATERNKNKKAKTQSLGDRSYNNLCAYRAGWVRDNEITAGMVAEFRKTYASGIRGHASGDNNQGEQDNTTNDCLAYKSWHTKKYGWI